MILSSEIDILLDTPGILSKFCAWKQCSRSSDIRVTISTLSHLKLAEHSIRAISSPKANDALGYPKRMNDLPSSAEGRMQNAM